MSFIHQPKPPSLCLWINHIIEVITTSHRFSLAADSHLADDSQPQSPLWQEIFKHDAAFLSFASLRLERASEVILLIEKSRLHSFLHPALIYLTSSSERKRLSLTVSFISRRSFFLFIYIYVFSSKDWGRVKHLRCDFRGVCAVLLSLLRLCDNVWKANCCWLFILMIFMPQEQPRHEHLYTRIKSNVPLKKKKKKKKTRQLFADMWHGVKRENLSALSWKKIQELRLDF